MRWAVGHLKKMHDIFKENSIVKAKDHKLLTKS